MQLCEPADDEDDVVEEQPRVHVSDAIRAAFAFHSQHLREARRKRREALKIQTVVPENTPVADAMDAQPESHALTVFEGGSSSAQATADFGELLPSDKYEGDAVLRTLHKLLSMVDDRGFARSPQQVQFHDSFIRACSRVMYRADWSMEKPQIMRRNQWEDCPPQILVSTPRRFGKTFSIAIFVAALALSCSLEIVIFSPARRASRKLLERIVEFLRLLDCGDRIVEYNQVPYHTVHTKKHLPSFSTLVAVSSRRNSAVSSLSGARQVLCALSQAK